MLKTGKTPLATALAELKTYLRIENSVEDALLSGLLHAATETVEAMLGVLLVERDVEEHAVVKGGVVALGAEPVRSLLDVRVFNEDGSATELDEDAYALSISRHGEGSLRLNRIREGASIALRYRAGMASDWTWVPEVLRLSVVRAAAHFHASRDAGDDGGLPPAVKRMLAPWRARRLR